MYIKNLELLNFRNYSDSVISFSEKLNVLSGNNAQGKTNCAEAIFLLCTGSSPRASFDREVIKSGCVYAKIKGFSISEFGQTSVEIKFFKKEKKTVKVNDIPVLKMGELLGNINAVYFSPDELKLIKEAPLDRRRFLDVSLSQLSKQYFYALNRYNKILSQRNSLLKEASYDVLTETLPIWDAQISVQGAKIISARNAFLKELAPLAKNNHDYLTDGLENLEIFANDKYDFKEEEIVLILENELKDNFEKDVRLKYTSVGPHRDDIKIQINLKDVKTYGSQGQQRSAALSMKLAETEIFKNRFGEYPVLILDDVLSELDKNRQKKLLSRVKPIQTILTTTHIDKEVFKDIEYSLINVENGSFN